MVEKNAWKWVKFSEKPPKQTGIYVVISHKKKENLYLDDYQSKGERILKSNEERKVQWAKWKYKEECDDITDDFVIYRKKWIFCDINNNIINDVIYYLILPDYPTEIVNEI